MRIAIPASRSLSPALVAGLIVLAFVVVAASAMLHTSPVFDEIVFMTAGARGFHTGDFSLVTDHPRLPQYLYGLPVFLSGIRYPSEAILQYDQLPRYVYARALLWGMGNPAEALVMKSRIVAIAMGAGTVAFTFAFARRHMGVAAALIATVLVAFLPDMLANSGIAYNDIALTFGYVLGIYAIDAAVRDPTVPRAAIAGLAIAFTLCTKYSGVILGPAAVALVALEALGGRWADRSWRRRITVASLVAAIVAYLAIALVYEGDWRLTQFIQGVEESLGVTQGRPGFLFGEMWWGGRWYFFPVLFFLKTPAALHVMTALAIVGTWLALRGKPWRDWVAHGARAPFVGAGLFLAGLVTADLNIGFRHALPMLPLLCILVAQGLEPLWDTGRLALRGTLGLLLAAFVASSMSSYPYFLAYVSEYIRGRPLYETVVDTTTDWGGGLVALRDFMREKGIHEVSLGILSSAVPDAYGIRYAPLPSFFTLPVIDPSMPRPRYAVVSASLIAGMYVFDDPYAALRRQKPVAVVGGSLYVFDLGQAQR